VLFPGSPFCDQNDPFCQAKYANWSLVVVYSAASVGTARDIILYNGFTHFDEEILNGGVYSSGIAAPTPIQVPPDGFQIPDPPNVQIDYYGLEGDPQLGVPPQGVECPTCVDSFYFYTNGVPHPLGGAGLPNAVGNMFDSAPSPGVGGGLDLDEIDVSQYVTPGTVPAGSASPFAFQPRSGDGVLTQDDFNFGGGESFFVGWVALRVNRLVPNFHNPQTSLTVDPAQAGAGEELFYTLSLLNNGPVAGTGVQTVDAVPAGETVVPGSLRLDGAACAAPVCTVVGNTLTVNFAQIQPSPVTGSSHTITFRATLDATVTVGQNLCDSATLTMTEVPTAQTIGPACVTIQPPQLGTPTKRVIDLGPGAQPQPGDTLQFTVALTKTSSPAANAITFRDDMPAFLRLIPGSVVAPLGATVTAQATGGANGTGFLQLDNVSIPASTPQVSVTFSAHVFTEAEFNAASVASGAINGKSICNQGSESAKFLPSPLLTDDPATSAASDPTCVKLLFAPVLGGSKVGAPASGQVQPGQRVDYTINLANTGNRNETLTLTDDLPLGVTGLVVDTPPISSTPIAQTISPPPAGANKTGQLVLSNVTVVPGASTQLKFHVTIDPAAADGTVVQNTVAVVVAEDATQNTTFKSGAVTVFARPVLAMTKTVARTAGAGVFQPGDAIRYTITIPNNGNRPATQTVLRDTIDANLTAVVPDSAGTFDQATHAVTWNLGTVAVGATTTVHIDAKVVSPLANGTVVSNQAFATANEIAAPGTPSDDPTTAAPGDPTRFTVQSAPNFAGMQKTVANTTHPGGPNAPGDVLRYTINLHNAGTAISTNTRVVDVLDPNLTFVAITSGTGTFDAPSRTITWTLGSMAPGDSALLVATARIVSPLANGTVIPNQAFVRSDQVTPPGTPSDDPTTTAVNDPTVVTVTSSATLTTSAKTVLDENGGNAQPGDFLTYTVTLTNTGNSPARSVVVTDVVSPLLTAIAPQDGGVLNAATHTITWTLAQPVLPGADQKVHFRAQISSPVADGTPLCNSAGITSTDQAGTATTAPVCVTVVSRPDLTTSTKTVTSSAGALFHPGDTVTYVITAINSGAAAGTNVVVSDPVDPNLTGVAALDNGAFDATTHTITWTLPQLASHAQQALHFTAKIVKPLDGGTVIANQAKLSSTEVPAPALSDDPTTPAPADPTKFTVTSAPDFRTSTKAVLDVNGGLVNPGDVLTYTLTIDNSGTALAHNVVVTDVLPKELTAIAPADGGVFDATTRTVTWTLPAPVPLDTPITLHVNAQVVTPLDTGTPVCNQGQIRATELASPQVTDDARTPTAGDPTCVNVSSMVDIAPTETVTDESATPVRPGHVLDYTISFTNTGNETARNLVVTEPVDPSLDAVAPGASGQLAAGIITWNSMTTPALAAVTPGATVTLTWKGTVHRPLANGTVISAQAQVAGPALPMPLLTDDPSTPAPRDATKVTVTSAATLAATKTVLDENGGAVHPGDFLTYTITLTNSGDAVATGVTVTDPLDANLVAVTPQDGGVFDPAARTLTWKPALVDVTPATVQLHFRAQVKLPLANGTLISNQAQVAFGTTMLLSDDPTTSAPNDPTKSIVVSAPDLSRSTKTVTGDQNGVVSPNGMITYTITVHNGGDATATGVTVTDVLPAALDTFTVGDGGTLGPAQTASWQGLTVAPGQDVTVHVTARVSPNDMDGTVIKNQARIHAAELATDTLSDDPRNGLGDHNSTDVTVSAVPKLVFTKTAVATHTPAAPGDTVTYTLTIQNIGIGPAFGVTVTDVVDPGLERITVQEGGGVMGQTVTWPPAQIGAGAKLTLTFTARVKLGTPDGTRIANQGSLTASGLPEALLSDDPSTPAPSDPTIITISSQSTLAAQKTVVDLNGGEALPGDTLEYHIRVTASGIDAHGVVLVDPVPALTSLVPGSITVNGVAQPNTALASGVTLATPGGDGVTLQAGDANAATVVFRVKIDPAAEKGALVSNQAIVSARDASPVRSDDPRTPEPSDPTVVVVGGGAGLITQKTYDPTPVGDDGNGIFDVGEQIQYRIRITNVGQAPATNVVLSDPLPLQSVAYVPGSLTLDGVALTDAPDSDAGDVQSGTVHVTVPTLAAGATTTVAFRARILAGPRVVNQGTVSAQGVPGQPTDSDGNPENGLTPTITPVGATPTYSISKVAADLNGGVLSPGDVILYTLTVHAPGGVRQGYNITDDLPIATTYQDGSLVAPPGAMFKYTPPPAGLNMRGSISVPGLLIGGPPGDDATITFRAQVAADAPNGTQICNVASVRAGVTGVQSDNVCLVVGAAVGQANVRGRVYQDINHDGVYGTADQALAGFTVQLLDTANAQAARLTATTGQDGTYQMTGAPPGTFVLRVLSPGGTQFATGQSVTLQAGGEQTADLLVDPSGRVYDSSSGAMVAGATLRLLYDDSDPAAGGQTSVPVPAEKLGVGQQAQVTSALGMYRFDAEAGHKYRIVVDTPPSLSFPSHTIPPQDGFASPGPVVSDAVPDPKKAGAQLKYYLKFALGSVADAVTNDHIPLDPIGSLVHLDKRADKAQASMGDIITYTITVQNGSARDILGAAVRDVLPKGLTYLRGTAHVMVKNAAGTTATFQPAENSSGSVGLGPFDLASGGTAVVVYQTAIGVDTREGVYENVAQLYAGGAPASNSDSARVRVVNDPIFDQGLLIGRVFCDQDGDGKPGPNEPGVFGARVYLDTGWYAVTDEDGKYHLKNIDPGVHLAKVDAATLPAGASLTGEPSSIIWFTRGLLAKANFAARCDESWLAPDEIKAAKAAAPPLPSRGRVRVDGDLAAPVLKIDGTPAELLRVSAVPDKAQLDAPGPVQFRTGVNGPTPTSWLLQVSHYSADGGTLTSVREFSGTGAPPPVIEWDGKELAAGAAYVYQLDVVGKAGVQGSSPLGVMTVADAHERVTASTRVPGRLIKGKKVVGRGRALVATLRGAVSAGTTVRVEGVSDRSSAIRALADSTQLAQAVRRQLIALGVPAGDVTAVGLGRVPAGGETGAKRERVVVVSVIARETTPTAAPAMPPTKPVVRVGSQPIAITGEHFAGEAPLPKDGRSVVELVLVDGRRFEVPVGAKAATAAAPAPAEHGGEVEGDLARKQATVFGRPLLLDLLGVELDFHHGGTAPPVFALDNDRLKTPLQLELKQPIANPATWRVTVRADGGEPVWHVSGQGEPPPELTWSGEDAKPALEPGRSYTVQLWVEDAQGGRGASPERRFQIAGSSGPLTQIAGRLWRPDGRPTAALLQFLGRAVEASKGRPLRVEVAVARSVGRPQAARVVAASARAAELKRRLIAVGAEPDQIMVRGVVASARATRDRVSVMIQSTSPPPPPAATAARVLVGGQAAFIHGDAFTLAVPHTPGAPVLVDVADARGHRAVYIVQPAAASARGPAVRAFRDDNTQVQIMTAGTPGGAGPTAQPGGAAPAVATSAVAAGRARAAGAPPAAPQTPTAGDLRVQLPPRGLLLRAPQLAVRGQTDPRNQITINGRAVRVRADGSFAELIPLAYGRSTVEIRSSDPTGTVALLRYPVEVSPTSFFLMALADGAMSTAWDGSGKLDLDDAWLDGMTTETTTQAGSVLLHGRVALYMKARVEGGKLANYLDITAHVDSAKRAEFEDFAAQIIDPARFYPVYGDTAQEIQDVRARDKVYISVQTDDKKGQLLVGNFRTQIRGLAADSGQVTASGAQVGSAQLLSYDRALYGGEIDVQRSLAAHTSTHVQAFVSRDDQLLAKDHNVFRSTGGSIYFLRHNQIVPGGERVQIVVRDRDSGMILSTQPLARDTDYAIDYSGGRLLLKAAVPSFADANLLGQNLAVSTTALTGHPVYIEVDYDYQTDGAVTNTVWGAHVAEQLGSRVIVGGGYVSEGRASGPDYTLWGLETKIKLGAHSTLSGEYARSQSSDADNFISQDGGLSFYDMNSTAQSVNPNDPSYGGHSAYGIDLMLDPADFTHLLKEDRVRAHAYVQVMERGFFSSGNIMEQGRSKYGAEIDWKITDRDKLIIRHDGQIANLAQLSTTFPAATLGTPMPGADTTAISQLETELLQVQYQATRGKWTWKGEYGHQYQVQTGPFTDGSIVLSPAVQRDFVAAQGAYQLSKRWTLRAGQEMVLHSSTDSTVPDPQVGTASDHRFATTTIGADYKLSKDLTLTSTAAVRWNGDTSIVAGIKTGISDTANVYANERLESTDFGTNFTSIVGAEDRFGDQKTGRTYGEYQLQSGVSGQTNRALLGLNNKWTLAPGFSVGGGYEHQQTFGGALPDGTPLGDQQRDVLSFLYEFLKFDRFKLAGRFEMRFDDMTAAPGSPCGGNLMVDPRSAPCLASTSATGSPAGASGNTGAAGAGGAGASGATGSTLQPLALSGPSSGNFADRTTLPGSQLMLSPGKKIEWFTSQTAEWQWAKNLTFLGRFSLLDVEDEATNSTEARLVELTTGISYRPLRHDWLNLIAKYTRLLELRPTGLGQGLHTDERSDVGTLMPIIELPFHLQLSEKVAWKHIDESDDVLFDPTGARVVGTLKATTDLLLWINRLSAHVTQKVDVAAEYRILKLWLPGDVEQIRHGALAEINYLVQKNVRLGVGFNFSRFGDNELGDLTRDAFGFFVRVVGRY
jgi:uncharacterized repeat protein (TIGR01451 family)